MGKTVKEDVEGWLTVIGLHLEEAEKAIQAGKTTLAESTIDAARDKLRHAKAAAANISN
jgi:hypothetical protein